MDRHFFASEAVCMGHPDKICDRISDYILDRAIEVDKDSHMAIEATIKNNKIFLYGECKTKAKLDYVSLAKFVLKDIGYDDNFEVFCEITEQSLEIDNAVMGDSVGAGDQGIMFGYANRDTLELMPLAIVLANKLVYRVDSLRKSGLAKFLKPDGKSQVVVEYEGGVPKRVDTVVMAVNHEDYILKDDLERFIILEVIEKVIDERLIDDDTKIFINSSGSFVNGGPRYDSGTTGRKIVCDSYGGYAPVGGGCFSSKDPTKVDRSGAYYARYVAKNVVANGLADECLIQVSYAIGVGRELSLYIDTKGTNKVSMDDVYDYVYKNFDFSVDNIIRELDLKRPIYYDLSCYGHFGRSDLDLSWEEIKK